VFDVYFLSRLEHWGNLRCKSYQTLFGLWLPFCFKLNFYAFLNIYIPIQPKAYNSLPLINTPFQILNINPLTAEAI